LISLFLWIPQLISWGIHMIMGRAAVPPGQSGRNGHARAGLEGWAALRSSSATGA
jgi:hypothetical protein